MCLLCKFHPNRGGSPNLAFFVEPANSVGGMASNNHPRSGLDHHYCATCTTSNFVDRHELCSITAQKERNFLYQSAKVEVSGLLVARYLMLIVPGLMSEVSWMLFVLTRQEL